MNFHVYGIEHNQTASHSHFSPDSSKVTQISNKIQGDKLRENLMVLNQFFAENPIETKKPQTQSVIKPADENDPKMLFLNLSSYKKKEQPKPTIIQDQQTSVKNLSTLMMRVVQRANTNSQAALIQPSPAKQNTKFSLPVEQLKASRVTTNKCDTNKSSQRTHRWLDMDVIERNEKWNNIKMEKREQLIRQKLDEEMIGCTFKPLLSKERVPRTYDHIQLGLQSPSALSINRHQLGLKDSTELNNKSRYPSRGCRQTSYTEIFRHRKELSKSRGYTDNLINF